VPERLPPAHASIHPRSEQRTQPRHREQQHRDGFRQHRQADEHPNRNHRARRRCGLFGALRRARAEVRDQQHQHARAEHLRQRVVADGRGDRELRGQKRDHPRGRHRHPRIVRREAAPEREGQVDQRQREHQREEARRVLAGLAAAGEQVGRKAGDVVERRLMELVVRVGTRGIEHRQAVLAGEELDVAHVRGFVRPLAQRNGRRVARRHEQVDDDERPHRPPRRVGARGNPSLAGG
jgi:hypothetical protein